jgi:ABC-type phosphate transport system substrate-binding protein
MLRVFFFLFLFIPLLHAENILVITNVSNSMEHVTKEELRKIYLKKRRFWKETKLNPLNLPPNDQHRQNFEKDILTMSAEKLDTYWMKQHYRGHRPPYRVESVKSMILFVKKVQGAIGYIPESQLVKGVKIIYRFQEK